ncbi:LSM14A mRNA processing body assembly factor b isoform 2-T2 [Pholidichthys leucotaenia]
MDVVKEDMERSSMGSSNVAAAPSFQSAGSYAPFSRAPVPSSYNQFGVAAIGSQPFGSAPAAGHSSPQLESLPKSPTLEKAVQAPVSAAPVLPAPVGQRTKTGVVVSRSINGATGSQKPPDLLEQRKAPEVQKVSQQDNEQGAVENRDPNKRQTAGPQSSNRRGRGRGNRSRGKVNSRRDGTVKFDEDFDFETANAQFRKEEIDKELQNKLKLKDDKGEKVLNGEDAEHAANEAAATEEDEAVLNTCYYDKSKSFFDNLSCDDTRDRRPTWAEERRMNAETFGLPLRHRGRGGYRGRGFMGPRGGRGRPSSRGSFGPSRGAPPGFRGGRGGRDFSDFEYRKENKVAA